MKFSLPQLVISSQGKPVGRTIPSPTYRECLNRPHRLQIWMRQEKGVQVQPHVNNKANSNMVSPSLHHVPYSYQTSLDSGDTSLVKIQSPVLLRIVNECFIPAYIYHVIDLNQQTIRIMQTQLVSRRLQIVVMHYAFSVVRQYVSY